MGKDESNFREPIKEARNEMRVAPCRVAGLIANVIQTIRETYLKEEEILIRVKGLDELPPILGDESQLSAVFIT